MNTAQIVGLTIARGAGSVAAHLVRGTDDRRRRSPGHARAARFRWRCARSPIVNLAENNAEDAAPKEGRKHQRRALRRAEFDYDTEVK
jgi:hypothetical protein